MKKVLSLFLVFILVTSLTACAGKENSSASKGSGAEQNSQAVTKNPASAVAAVENIYPADTAYTHIVNRQYLYSLEIPYGPDSDKREILGSLSTLNTEFDGYVSESFLNDMYTPVARYTHFKIFGFHDGADIKGTIQGKEKAEEVITNEDLESAEGLANHAMYFIDKLNVSGYDKIVSYKLGKVEQTTYGGQDFYRVVVEFNVNDKNERILALTTELNGVRLAFVFTCDEDKIEDSNTVIDSIMSTFTTYKTVDETMAIEKEIVQGKKDRLTDWLFENGIDEKGEFSHIGGQDSFSYSFPALFVPASERSAFQGFYCTDVAMDWDEFTATARKGRAFRDVVLEEVKSGSFEHSVYGKTTYKINLLEGGYWEMVCKNSKHYLYLIGSGELKDKDQNPYDLDALKQAAVGALLTIAKTAYYEGGLNGTPDISYEDVRTR